MSAPAAGLEGLERARHVAAGDGVHGVHGVVHLEAGRRAEPASHLGIERPATHEVQSVERCRLVGPELSDRVEDHPLDGVDDRGTVVAVGSGERHASDTSPRITRMPPAAITAASEMP